MAAERSGICPVARNVVGITMPDPDITFLARQNERMMTEIGTLRDDVRVLSAIIMRLDSAHGALLTAILEELRHTQIARMNDRVRRLEDERT